MRPIIPFLLTVILMILKFTNANSYCQYTCRQMERKEHVMCVHPNSGHSPRCGRIIQGAISAAEKEEIVRLHNELRQKVAKGQELRGNPGPQPAAQFMPDLTWDDELADIAQRWADQCDFGHRCSTVERFQVGQNIYRMGYGNIMAVNVVEQAVYNWYNEVNRLDGTTISSYVHQQDSSKTYGHYTQMVWARTDKIGCGITKYSNTANLEYAYIVCNYGRGGNLPRAPVYIPV